MQEQQGRQGRVSALLSPDMPNQITLPAGRAHPTCVLQHSADFSRHIHSCTLPRE
jgi:hypothetical protein